MHPLRFYTMPIERLRIATHLQNRLKDTGITTIGKMLEFMSEGPAAILSIPGFDDDALDELLNKFHELNANEMAK